MDDLGVSIVFAILTYGLLIGFSALVAIVIIVLRKVLASTESNGVPSGGEH